MKHRLLATTAICGLAFFAATPAFATCDIHHPTNGDTITCSTAGGTDLLGVEDGTDNITVNVNAGAGVHPSVGGDDAITIGSGTVNLGAGSDIQSSSAVAIHGTDAGGGVVSVIDAGGSTISGGTYGILLESGGNVTIGNGTTVSGATGIRVANADIGTASVVRISSGATITGNVSTGANVNDEYHYVADTSTNFATGNIGSSITGFEKFYKDGTGTTTLTGTNAKNWNISDGTLIANYNAISNVTGTGGTFQIENTSGNIQTYAGNITGDIDVIAHNASQLTLTGNNTFTGGLTVNGGAILWLEDNAAASATSGITLNGGYLAFGADTYTADINIAAALTTLNSVGNDITLAGNITGGAGHNANINGGSIYTLTGTNSFGDFILANGSTIRGAGSALGNASSSFSGTSGTVDITGGTIVSSIGGALNVKLDNATATLAGTNGFTGTLTLTNGAGLTVNSAATFSGTSGVSLSGASNFGFGSNMTSDRNFSIGVGNGSLFTNGHDVTLSGAFTGNGYMYKESAGTLTLTGTTSAYSGAMFVNAGTLLVDGTVNNSVIANNGGTIGGSGAAGIVEADTGGTLTAGSTTSIGTLHANFFALFDPGSHYSVQYNSSGASDIIVAGSNIIIDGAAILDLTGVAGTYAPNTTYTILQSTGGAIAGTFGTINNNLAFLDATQHNNGTTLTIDLARNDIDFADPTKNETQAGAANAVQDLGPGNDLYDAFAGLSTDQVAGVAESLSSAGTISVVPSVAAVMTAPVMTHIGTLSSADVDTTTSGSQHADNSDPSVYTAAYIEPAAGSGPVDDSLSIWMQAIGGFGHTLGDSQSPGQQRSAYGAVGGIDRAFADSGLFGVYGGYQRGEVSSNAVGASADLNSYMLGAYMSHPVGGGFALSGGLSGIYHDIDTVRHVIVGATGFSPHGDTNGSTLNAFAELDKPMQWGDANVTGFGNVSVTRNHMNGYSEHDGGAADLVVGDTTQTNPATTLGIRGNQQLGALNVGGSFGWQHTFGDVDPDATMHFVGGTTTFDSVGTPIARDAAVVGVNVSGNLGNGGKAYLGYDGTLAKDAQDHGFKAGLKWNF